MTNQQEHILFVKYAIAYHAKLTYHESNLGEP